MPTKSATSGADQQKIRWISPNQSGWAMGGGRARQMTGRGSSAHGGWSRLRLAVGDEAPEALGRVSPVTAEPYRILLEYALTSFSAVRVAGMRNNVLVVG